MHIPSVEANKGLLALGARFDAYEKLKRYRKHLWTTSGIQGIEKCNTMIMVKNSMAFNRTMKIIGESPIWKTRDGPLT